MVVKQAHRQGQVYLLQEHCIVLIHTEFLILSLGARFEDYMFEKLDRQTPLRPSNSFCLGQTMAYAGREIGPGVDYGKICYKLSYSLN